MIKFFNTAETPHAKFVQDYNNGSLILTVDTNAAGYLFQSLLIDHASKEANYRTILFGGILGGMIAIFFVGWWSLVGFALGFLGKKLSAKHTDEAVIAEALKSPEAYYFLADKRILAYIN